VFPRNGHDDLGGEIGGPVVDDNDLPWLDRLIQQSTQRSFDVFGLVVSRDENAYIVPVRG